MFEKNNTGQVEALQDEIKKLRDGNKVGSAELAAARSKAFVLEAEIIRVRVELDSAKAAVIKARKRQKNSVERANRFKSKAAKNGNVASQ